MRSKSEVSPKTLSDAEYLQAFEASEALRAQIHALLARLDRISAALEENRKPVYTVEELARLVGRDPYTVRAWIRAGKVRATRVAGTGPKGRLQVDRAEIDRIIAGGLGGHVPDSGV